MDEKRKNLYYLKTTGDAKALERGIAKIEGVTFARVDSAKKTLEYEIDEKASDYDVFTEVMQKVADAGADIDFERDDTKGGEAPDDSSAGPEEKLPPETEEAAPEKEKRKPWDENLVRVFELGFAIICFVAAMFIHHRIAKLIVLALSFSVAGYDALYEAWVKMTKKVIFSYELVISLAAFACILTGRVEYTVAAMVLYSVVNFVRKYIVMRMDKNSVYWENPEKVHITSESGTFEKDYALVVPGETAVFYKGGASCWTARTSPG